MKWATGKMVDVDGEVADTLGLLVGKPASGKMSHAGNGKLLIISCFIGLLEIA